jgi:phage portal protein BeeE
VPQYAYRTGSKEQSFDPMDIVNFKLPDPANFYRGHSPVQSIRYSIDTHKKADGMNTKKLDNFAFVGGSVETDKPVLEVRSGHRSTGTIPPSSPTRPVVSIRLLKEYDSRPMKITQKTRRG